MNSLAPLPLGPSQALGCPHAPRCPGCPLITQPYEAGLALKAEQLGRALGRYPELSGVVPEPLTGATASTGYRVRTKLVADAQGRLGLFAAGSHDVVDIPECRVQHPALFEVAAALRALLPLPMPISGVDLRLADRGVLMCLIVDGPPDPALLARTREEVLEHVPRLVSLALSVRQPGAVQLLGAELTLLAGTDAEPHHLSRSGPWLYASHGAFTQVHAEQTTRLHERVEALLEARLGSLEGQRVLEFYAGSGALGLRLAARGARVTAVETFEPARRRLAAAALAQSLAVVTVAGDSEDFVAGLGGRGRAGPRTREFDVVLVNPPRRGLSAEVRSGLAELGPRLVVYVSCNPETLARDASHLTLLGWQAQSLAAFDLIPLTDALESLALFAPAPPPLPRVLFEDAHSLALYKLPFEPTTPQGESNLSLLERARVGLGLPELTPIHRLDQGTSGVCWFARRPSLVAPLAQALERGHKTYIALGMGVTHKKGTISRPLADAGKLRPATTRYRRLEVVGGHSLLELHPEHGRKHQLRRHLASVGHALLGDVRYGKPSANRHFEHRHGLDRPFLHCARLQLELDTGPVDIRADLPGDLDAVLESVRK